VSRVGGIPLRMVIHKYSTSENHIQAFNSLRKYSGETAFCEEQQPLIFMTDENIAERQALKVVFPKSTLLHLCQALYDGYVKESIALKKMSNKV